LKAVLNQAVEQHRLLTSEREQTELTLRGSVQALVEVLALSNPAAFGRATRVQSLVSEVAALIGYRDCWQIEMAAVLSQLGVLSIPPETALRYGGGAELSAEEEAIIARFPEVALRLLRNIPRLDEIREILQHLTTDFESDGRPGTSRGEEIPLGALLIRPLLEYDLLLSRGCRPDEAMGRLRARGKAYDPAVLSDIGRVTGADSNQVIMELNFQNVQLGMAFIDDVRAPDGTLLVARGQEVTPALLARIDSYWSDMVLPAPVRVRVRQESTSDAPSLIDVAT
jgi:response regulator RpfG family c-di-GMP phosphodiesterase